MIDILLDLPIHLRVALEMSHISQLGSGQCFSSSSSSHPSPGNSDASALVLSASTAALEMDAPIIMA